MKNIFIASFYLFFIGKICAQDKIELSKEAKKKFEGRWMGIFNNDTITIVLLQTRSKVEDINPVDSIVFLYGWHKISNNHKVLESSLDSISMKLDKLHTIIASYKSNQRQLQLSIFDLTRERWLNGELNLSNNKSAILTTSLKEAWRDGNKTYLEGQTFPAKIVMKRITTTVPTIFR
ncbi:DUF6705 family protein [Sediminibacterium sp.]|uniref:DUF6705 family protein n=1 Tax=Sediminibacterium sp. TaxID=1917865 RepID=UPI002733AFE2|nr:DUF6705 family protein [Sediminibacterium sp.]MDP3393310.1 hypothetical protein [Sediminibacterium sp.]MDP3567912.1 hypothetical protein [Sediminibacterium sp.]